MKSRMPGARAAAVVLLVLPLIAAASPDRRVRIRRDAYGVPHILASSLEAAGYGLGYAQAEDHGLTMIRQYVAARGESARYYGTDVENDLLLAFFDVRPEAERDLAGSSRRMRSYLRGFADGVNRYVETHRSEFPPWAPRITAADLLAHRRAAAIRQVCSRETVRSLERKSKGGAEGGEKPEPQPTPELEGGSNAFALAGSRTASGAPILLGNPHLGWSSLYWEAQITVPGMVDFFGSTLAGIPVLRAGFNEHLGWVTTNNYPDHTDIYALALDPDRPDHYLFDNRARALKRREVSAQVLGPDGKVGEEKRTFWESHIGKIIFRAPSHAYAVRSAFIEAPHYYQGFLDLSLTRNLGEFRAVLGRNRMPMSNYTYADTAGNIFYQYCGRVPIRTAGGRDYSLDLPARGAADIWKRLHPPAALPSLLNPNGGYSQNCNNPPWFNSLRAPLDPSRYPEYLERETELELRPQMALAMLESREKFSLEEVMRLKFDNRMLLADRVKPALLTALREAPGSADNLRLGIAILEAWDNRVESSSRGAVLFQRFWDTYGAGMQTPYAVPWTPADPSRTPRGLSDMARAAVMLGQAVEWTRRTYGAADVAWGDVHRFRFGDLDLPADGASGSYGLFRVMRFTRADDGKMVAGQVRPNEPPVGFGDAWVLAVEFSKPIRAFSVLAYGQTTKSDSPHSRDQISLFAGHRYKPVWFREEEIRAHLEREYAP